MYCYGSISLIICLFPAGYDPLLPPRPSRIGLGGIGALEVIIMRVQIIVALLIVVFSWFSHRHREQVY